MIVNDDDDVVDDGKDWPSNVHIAVIHFKMIYRKNDFVKVSKNLTIYDFENNLLNYIIIKIIIYTRAC